MGLIKERLGGRQLPLTTPQQPPTPRLATPKPAIPKPQTKYMSGNLLQDVIDILSTAQYATAGLLQKGAPLKGVKERASWVDYLKEKSPEWGKPIARIGKFELTPANIIGTGMDILIDPLWLIPPAKIAKTIGRGAKAAGITAKVAKAVEVSPLAGKIEKFTAPALQLPLKPSTRRMLKAFEEIQDTAVIQASGLMQPAMKVSREISRHPSHIQNLITEYAEAGTPALRQAVLQKATAQQADPKLIQRLGDEAVNIDTKIGQALVDAGLMKPETLQKWQGKHLRRVYQRYEDTEAFIKQLEKADPRAAAELRSTMENMGVFAARVKAPAMRPKIPLGAVKERKALTQAERQALGEITEAGYRLGRGAQVGALAASRANMLKQVADNFGEVAWKPGFLRMPEGKEWGALAGKWVPEAIHSQLNEWSRLPGKFEQMSRRIVGSWKFGKVVLNPSTHGRNIISNFLLADNAGLSPARVDIYAEALTDLARNGKWIQEARRAGTAFVDTFVERELPRFLDALQKAPGGLFDKAGRALSAVGAKFAQAYQFEEQWGKLAIYIFKRKAGLSPKDAARVAEEWLFNYRKVPKWVENIRSGRYGPITIPFLTFPYKAIPAYARALYQNPARVARWGKYGMSVERAGAKPEELLAEAKVQPEWMKKGFWLRLPIEDQYKRPLYLDLNYILPFADIFNTSGLFGKGESPGFASMPIIDLYQDVVRNQSRFTGRPIWPEGGTPTQKQKAVTQYVADFLLPPLAGGYNFRKVRDAIMGVPDWKGRTAKLDVTLAHVLFGLKTRPVKIEEEKVNRMLEIEDQLRALRANLRNISEDPRMPNKDKNRYWQEGLEAMNRLIGEMAEYGKIESGAK